ncbi:MAG: hypothetical protein QOK18_5960 [Mycobacterium sp.]|jgi:hypothetical protein|nr:hypothetical protein [Mycobacterium sp.]MDT5217721.1 hypothetical protein [Mycobacterium sp.]
MRAVATELDKKFGLACVEDFPHRLLGELAVFIELVEWAAPLDSSGNSVDVTELGTRHPNPPPRYVRQKPLPTYVALFAV